MLRRIFNPHITIAVSNLCRTSVPVRFYPRRSLPLPPEVLDRDFQTFDAYDESEITSELERMEDELRFENKKIERERQRQWLKKKILQRKYYKEPQALNLLSWTAKEQIRYLHAEYPEEWTVQKLAQSFPVSEKGIIKILKSDIIVYSQKDIDKHDRRVRKNWKQIQQQLNQGIFPSSLPDGSPIAETVKHLAETNKLAMMINAGGMDEIKLPVKKEMKRKQIGLFEGLVKDYVESSERMEKDTADLNARELLNSISKFKPSKIKLSDEHDVDDVEYRTENKNVHSQTQFSRQQKRLMQEVPGAFRYEDAQLDNVALQGTGRVADSPKTRSVHSDSQYSEQLRHQEQREQREILSKIKFDKPQSRHGVRESSEGYMYDSVSGYQYPLGKVDENLNKIEVPKSGNKGDLYLQGKYVYDEDGEFLYKIP